MSKDKSTTTDMTVKVPNEGEGVHSETQYGCRYPDGTALWAPWRDGYGQEHTYKEVALGQQGTKLTRWHEMLTRRANEANIQVSEYIEAHTFLKRTVILATTKAEEV